MKITDEDLIAYFEYHSIDKNLWTYLMDSKRFVNKMKRDIAGWPKKEA